MIRVIRPATRLDIDTLVMVDQGIPIIPPVLRLLRTVVPPDPHGFLFIVTNPENNAIGKYRRAFVIEPEPTQRQVDHVLSDIATILEANPNTMKLGSLVRELVNIVKNN